MLQSREQVNANNQLPVPTHWSKDFVEHLRAVHFALIAVCAGLIVLITSAKTYDARIALRQVQDIIRLQELWSPQWAFENLGSSHFDKPRELKIPAWLASQVGIWKTVVGEDIQLPPDNEVVIGDVFYFLEQRHEMIQFLVPKAEWFDRAGPASALPHIDLDHFPKTLPQFEAWWNLIATSRRIYMPFSIAKLGELSSDGKVEAFVLLSPWLPTQRGKPPPIKLYMDLRDPRSSAIEGYLATSPTTFKTSYFPFIKGQMFMLNQSSVGKVFSWATGRFEHVFYDLHQAAFGIESWDLSRIRDQLAEEAGKGGDTFEALGMKFPVSQLTTCGSILVLSIQLYFLIYLRQLFGKLQADDSGWDVPWLGMDQSRLARYAFFGTMVILPMGTLALIAGYSGVHVLNAAVESSSIENRLIATVPTLVVPVLATLASIVLALCSWRVRPTMAAATSSREPG